MTMKMFFLNLIAWATLVAGMGLAQVDRHWATQREDETPLEVRPVLAGGDGFTETIDDLLLDLKLSWDLVLNINPDRNIDDGGRELGIPVPFQPWRIDQVGRHEHR